MARIPFKELVIAYAFNPLFQRWTGKEKRLKALKEHYIKQMLRIQGAKGRKFDQHILDSWWTDGVKAFGFEAADIEHAATELSLSSDPFPILSTFIHHCSASRRERKALERQREKNQEEKARDLSTDDILKRGAKTAQGPKAKAAIENTMNFLAGKIDRVIWAKNQDKIEKGEL